MNLSHVMRWSVTLVLFSTAGAQAGQLSIRFAGGGSEVELAAGEAVILEIVWTMGVTDTTKSGARLTGLDMRFNTRDGDGNPISEILVFEGITVLPGWDSVGTQPIGQPFYSSTFLSLNDPSGVGIVGNGTSFETVLATLLLRSSLPIGTGYITIRHDDPADPLPSAFNGAAAWLLKWQEEVNGPNQFELGIGNPGDEGNEWDPTHGLEDHQPLIVTSCLREGCPLTGRALELTEAYPGLQVYFDPISCNCAPPTAFYGRLMTSGANPADAAESWLSAWAQPNNNVFGIDGLGLLRLERSNEVGSGESNIFVYRQYFLDGESNEVLVEPSKVRLLVWNGSSPRKVAYVGARGLIAEPVGGFRTDEFDGPAAVASVQGDDEYDHLSAWSDPVKVIYHDYETPPTRVWKFSGTNIHSDGDESYTFFVDSHDLSPVHVRDEVGRASLQGRVTGYATPGVLPDMPYNPPQLSSLPGAGLWLFDTPRVAGNASFSDRSGEYVLAYEGGGPVVIRADLFGPWVNVVTQSGSDLLLERSVGAPATVDFEFNGPAGQAPFPEIATAQVNALVHVTQAHDFYKDRQPDYDGLDFPLRCTINYTLGACGGILSAEPYPTMKLDAAGSAAGVFCPNGANATSIAHEYGHFINVRLGSSINIGPFVEGFADSFAALRFNDAVLFRDGWGEGTFGRDLATSDKQYPCSPGEDGHQCGLALAGSWWDLKLNLERILPDTGLELARQLFTDWSQLTLGNGGPLFQEAGGSFAPNPVHPLVPIEVLVVDDLAYGDGNLSNGTPHDCAICVAFAQHNLPCPGLLLGEECTANGIPDRCERDCNYNSVADSCEIAAGSSQDCTGNGIPDQCEPDCNYNAVADSCDIAGGTSIDCTIGANGIPDECEPDCNANGTFDSCEIGANPDLDCPRVAGCTPPAGGEWGCFRGSNGILDECELAIADCNNNGIADSCDVARRREPDCNGNDFPDGCDIQAGTSVDCPGHANGIPDECEPDCDENGLPDECEIAGDPGLDCDRNGALDACEMAQPDCNGNATADCLEIVAGTATDCDGNRIPDPCDWIVDPAKDCLGSPNSVLDECEKDCNRNGTADTCDIDRGSSPDCNGNRIPDGCDLSACVSLDCNGNSRPDECDIAGGTSADLNQDGVPDECLSPPVIVCVASVGHHKAAPGWAGGEIAIAMDPVYGGIEPRIMVPTVQNQQTQMFVRVVFDRAMDAVSVAGNVTVTPSIGPIQAVGSLDAMGAGETVKIEFFDSGNAPAAVPAGHYRFDLSGMLSSDPSARAGGDCASFPIAFLTGDVNGNGRVTGEDVVRIANLVGPVTPLGDRPRADFNRNGIINLPGDGAAVQNSPNYALPGPPVAPACRPMDFDCGGRVDLADYAQFDRCTSSQNGGLSFRCASAFDSDADSDLDLVDLEAFLDAMVGPPPSGCEAVGGSVARAGGDGGTLNAQGDLRASPWAESPALDDESGEPDPAPPLPWALLQSVAGLEVVPVEGEGPVTILEPGTHYGIYYTGVTHPIEGYVAFFAGTEETTGVTLAEPPTGGSWADTGLFSYADCALEPQPPALPGSLDEGLELSDLVMDDLIEPAEGTGPLLQFVAGTPGEVSVRLWLYLVDEEAHTTYEVQAQLTIMVMESSADL